jgi:hypothetical protein
MVSEAALRLARGSGDPGRAALLQRQYNYTPKLHLNCYAYTQVQKGEFARRGDPAIDLTK